MSSNPIALVGRKHPALARPADEVTDFDDAHRLARRMIATLQRLRGHALAAPQVGWSKQLVVSRTLTLANPRIVATKGEVVVQEEGCLSLPGRWFLVPRYETVTVLAQNLDGDEVEFTTHDPIQARMWAHEADHLAGELLLGRFEEIRGERRR